MNVIWTVIVILSVAVMALSGNGNVLSTCIEGCEQALSFCFMMCAFYTFWGGFFGILEKSGILNKVTNVVKPFVKMLYGQASDRAVGYIALNMTANLLGVANASTPSALSAIQQLQEDNGTSADKQIALLFVINATSIQLLPSTVIAMRTKFLSVNPMDILLPTLIATAATTVLGIVLIKLSFKSKQWRT